ncbi:uncharacterized protein K452DRAFT_53721 [Aplosporella prunicola CBS 121167]|uniref:Uncharacterized protein n=1 Tax=Aplosporella prunicola CBS 121167 TaxID=1176127 RepID=A0A6A6B7V8_9PEZI|nr:uncharacterized protein K452DRAFT_53721 [Aplosporella prunicola CBS 121167]KAF2140282.1 hypothetical protein K452DRAFT_53721 [Aplosporella prunicola CBS 121167]
MADTDREAARRERLAHMRADYEAYMDVPQLVPLIVMRHRRAHRLRQFGFRDESIRYTLLAISRHEKDKLFRYKLCKYVRYCALTFIIDFSVVAAFWKNTVLAYVLLALLVLLVRLLFHIGVLSFRRWKGGLWLANYLLSTLLLMRPLVSDDPRDFDRQLLIAVSLVMLLALLMMRRPLRMIRLLAPVLFYAPMWEWKREVKLFRESHGDLFGT